MEYFFIGICVFVVIAIIAMLTIYIPSVAGLANDHTKNEIKNAVFANASAADTYFASRLSYLDAATLEFKDADVTDIPETLARCQKIQSISMFRHVGFTGVDGVTVSSTGGVANTSNRTFVQEGLAKERSITPHAQCDFDGATSDMYTVPVYNGAHEFVGALTGDCVPLTMNDIPVIDVAGDCRCFFILESDGDILYCSDLNSAGIGGSDNLVALIDDENAANDIGYLLNSTARDEIKRFTIKGRELIGAFAPINGQEWTFAAVIPLETAYSSLNSIIVINICVISVMSFLVLASIVAVIIRLGSLRRSIIGAIDASLKSMYNDPITGYDSMERFRENFSAAMKNTSSHALISLDINRFKAVNDMFGYEGGNDIIRRLADIIKRSIGKNDFFARSSGDRFYIFTDSPDKNEISTLAERILSDVEYQVTEVKLDIAIGVYVIDDPHIRSRVAADRADMARDIVKKSKIGTLAFFDTSMLEKIRREKKIEDIMEDSLALGEFLVYLQPKFSLGEKNEVVGAEALVRWMHDGKLIPPGEFIPLFERNGFVTKIDYYMFEEVCKLQKKYAALRHEPKVISVNMSRLHLNKPNFVAELASICEKYDVETKYIEIEITESAAYENMDTLYDIFREIKKYGFHVSIDDFGTGYSSLNMLKDLPVDVLKIDRSFLTENADEHENASLIIGCVVSLAASLNIFTICEGIETKEQAILLAKLGCNMAQGFYFARPMPVADYEKLAYGSEIKL